MATERQKRAIKKLVENGGNVSRAMREAEYSPETAKNPQKLTRSKGYAEILKRAGVTDEMISKKQKMLLEAAHTMTQEFPAARVEKTVGKGNKEETTSELVHVSDKEIRRIIQSVPGHKILYNQTGTDKKNAHCQVPAAAVQTKQVELVLKVKGHFAPEQHDIITHEMTPEEIAVYEKIMGKNKKT